MITLYLIFKLTGWLLKLVINLMLLPFYAIILPFKILFGKPKKKNRDNKDSFWEGFFWGGFFF